MVQAVELSNEGIVGRHGVVKWEGKTSGRGTVVRKGRGAGFCAQSVSERVCKRMSSSWKRLVVIRMQMVTISQMVTAVT